MHKSKSTFNIKGLRSKAASNPFEEEIVINEENKFESRERKIGDGGKIEIDMSMFYPNHEKEAEDMRIRFRATWQQTIEEARDYWLANGEKQ